MPLFGGCTGYMHSHGHRHCSVEYLKISVSWFLGISAAMHISLIGSKFVFSMHGSGSEPREQR